jgi:F420-dependent oxidoreductase-like protein
MRIGLQVPSFSWPDAPASIGPRLAEIARTADDAGFASLWVMDHFFQISMVGPPEEPMLEGYTTLGYLAGLTKQVRLGLLVTGVHYRYPGILAKTITTLDVLSGGRAYLGIGAGWNEQESRGLGVPFPSTRARFEQLEETLQIVRQMWADDRTPYQGQHFQLADPLNHPLPLSQPHPPIMVGGAGEKKTLRLVAQYADACNLFVRLGEDGLREKLDILRQHCEDVGRPYDEIERTALGTIDLRPGKQSVDEVIALCRSMADIGIQHLIFNMPNVHEITPLEIIGREIIPAVAEL